MGPPRGHKPCQQTCFIMGSSLHGSAASARSLLQHGLPAGSLPPSGIHLLQCGDPFLGYRWMSAPLWTSMDCRRTACLTMVFITSQKGTLSAPASQGSPPPSFFTDLGVCRDVPFTLSHFSLFTAISPQVFFHLLKHVMTEVLPPLLIGLALASGGSTLVPAGTGFSRHRGSFWQLLTEATPIAPQLPKPCHANP